MDDIFRSEVYSVALSGLSATLVTITVAIQAGPPDVELIGLAPSCVLGTKYRVLSALGQLGEYLDDRRVAVRFSPTGLHNDGTFDLAIATGVLSALKQRPLARTVVLGELWPSGAVRAVRGGLPALLGVTDMLGAIVPWNNGPETSCLTHMELRVAGHLGDVADYLDGKRELGLARALPQPRRADVGDMADIRGVTAGRRAAEIATAGLHSMLLVGAPGSGKTTLSSCIPTVMPEMTHAEVVEVTSIYSLVGHLEEDERGLVLARPFRSPHPNAGRGILVGRRSPLQPGEVSLAHHGVLFLENMQTAYAGALYALDKALRAGQVVLSTRKREVTFPARPLFVAGTFPCPCGFHGVEDRECKCTPEQIRAYRRQHQGPVFDHLDLQVLMSGYTTFGSRSESSASVRVRVSKAWEPQRHRFERGEVSAPVNGRLSVADLERVAAPDQAGRRILDWPALAPELRAKVQRVARTIADLDGSDGVRFHHVAEALQFAPHPEAWPWMSTARLPS
jgi:magnesium chelatase family protein